MSTPAPRSARSVAAEVLRRFDTRRDYAAGTLDRLLDQTQERQRATDLVYGTLRNLQAVDAVVERFSGRPTRRIAQPLLVVIRMAVYELAYSPATPTYSVVNEAVNVAKAIGGKKQTGFVNAVLRQIVRHMVDRQADLSTSRPRRTLVRERGAGCAFDTDFLPDPDASPAAYLSTCFSLPTWLVDRWLADFGPAQTRRICAASNRRPSVYLRVNTLRTGAPDLLGRFEQAGVQAEIVPPTVWAHQDQGAGTDGEAPSASSAGHGGRPAMLKVTSPQSVMQLPGFSDGLWTVQDLSASRAVCVLNPQAGWTILDMCAAPGTKTTQLAEATQGAAKVIATDVAPRRLERVRENVARLGPAGVTVLPYAQLEGGTIGPFDAVLLDVPCSNTGVLAKRIEVRSRIRPAALAELAATQRTLLEKAAGLVRPGGTICYSTCSIQRQENEGVIAAFLADHGGFELAGEALTLPSAEGFDHDGAYVALLTSETAYFRNPLQ